MHPEGRRQTAADLATRGAPSASPTPSGQIPTEVNSLDAQHPKATADPRRRRADGPATGAGSGPPRPEQRQRSPPGAAPRNAQRPVAGPAVAGGLRLAGVDPADQPARLSQRVVRAEPPHPPRQAPAGGLARRRSLVVTGVRGRTGPAGRRAAVGPRRRHHRDPGDTPAARRAPGAGAGAPPRCRRQHAGTGGHDPAGDRRHGVGGAPPGAGGATTPVLAATIPQAIADMAWGSLHGLDQQPCRHDVFRWTDEAAEAELRALTAAIGQRIGEPALRERWGNWRHEALDGRDTFYDAPAIVTLATPEPVPVRIVADGGGDRRSV